MFRPFRLLILTGLLIAAVVAPSAAQGKAAIGISDNKPTMFTDADFKALGLRHARVVVGWNVMSPRFAAGKAEKARFAAWMAGAKANNIRVLLAFDNSKDKLKAPSPKKLASELKKIRKAYPQIKQISPWNEPNLSNKKPKQVAEWTKAIKKACRTCTIVADVVDKPNLVSWTKSYVRQLGKSKIKVWGLHNYVDANNFQTKRTKAFMKATKKGDVWLTETGGVVGRNTSNNSNFAGKGIDHQTKAMTFLFDKLVKPFKRVKRVYIYNFDNDRAFEFLSWDSALKDNLGVLRPSYEVVKANR